MRKRLESRLTQTVMHFTAEAHFDHRVYVSDLSQSPAFGREGWQRPFPRRIDDPQARRQIVLSTDYADCDLPEELVTASLNRRYYK